MYAHTHHVYTYIRKMLYIHKGKKKASIYAYVCINVHSFKRQGRPCVLFAAAGGGGGSVVKSCPTIATPWTVDRQAPLSMGFSRQGRWSGLALFAKAF